MKRLLALVLFIVSSTVALSTTGALAQTIDTLVPTQLIVPAKYAAIFDSAHTVYLPKGFRCSVYYTQPSYWAPRMLSIDPEGRLAVADQGLSRVLALSDPSNAGFADTAIQLAYDDSGAHSVQFYRGALYAAAAGFVMKYEHPNAAGLYTDSSRFIDHLPTLAEGKTNHTTRTLLFDTVANYIYMSVGAPCNACRERDSERATILRFDLDGAGRRIYATGLRNAVGLTMDPVTRDIWISVAERNSLGEDLPHEFATKLTENGFYGWPIAYGDHEWDNFQTDSEYHTLLPITQADSAAVAGMQVPEIYLDAHSTPLSLAFYRAHQFPSSYYGDLFITLHGSANSTDGRIVANGSKIVRAKNVGGAWVTSDFATGFLTDSINYQRWARPCGILIDTAGDLYFSSDHSAPHSAAAIYKISYVGGDNIAATSVTSASLHVYPDPVTDHARIELTGATPFTSLTIVDLLGRTLLGPTLLASDHPTQHFIDFDTRSLPNGVYVARAVLRTEVLTVRFVIAH